VEEEVEEEEEEESEADEEESFPPTVNLAAQTSLLHISERKLSMNACRCCPWGRGADGEEGGRAGMPFLRSWLWIKAVTKRCMDFTTSADPG